MHRSLNDCQTRYGVIQNGVWADVSKWCKLVVVPSVIAAKLINVATDAPTQHIYMNVDMEAPFLQACQNLVDRGCLGELETFDGCFMIRDVRAEPGHPSCHSYALAVDLNAKKNPLGGVPTLSSAFVKCFTDAGFSWGGNFTRKDGMHFSYAWE